MKKTIILMLFFFTSYCVNKDNDQFGVLLILANTTSVSDFSDECKNEYGKMSDIFPGYYPRFSMYSDTCENAIIGDSTLDEGEKVTGFYDSSKTNNYAVSANTACDYLYQMQYIKCAPKNVIIGTADINGVIRNIDPYITIKTIGKVIAHSKEKWNAKVILIGIHPVAVTRVNETKNEVNESVKNLPDCYIDPLPIFGVGPNNPPPPAYMTDSFHYKDPVYTLYKNQIQLQCGVSI